MGLRSYPIHLVKSDGDIQPGQWKGARSDTGRTALVGCPACGDLFSLSRHTIDAQGNVKPSVVCGCPPCDFHEHVVLDDWTPE